MNRKKNSSNTYRNAQQKVNNSRPVRSSQMSADERIVNRANIRRRKNRRKKIIIRSVLGGTFLLVAIILVLVMFFNVNNITVSGDDVYSESDIIETSGANIGDNLIFISGKKISKNLTEGLPYIGSVKIKRHLPATLEIVVTKTTPAFAVFTDSAYSLLDKNGKVLEKGLEMVAEDIVIANLGKITSAKEGHVIELKNAQTFDKFIELKKACDECGVSGITSVDITDIYNIKLIYQGRITLELGETDSSNLIRKLDLGKAAIKTQDEENNTYRGTINLTVAGKGYWSEETSTTEPPKEEFETVTNENGEAVTDENGEAVTQVKSEKTTEKSEEKTTEKAEENTTKAAQTQKLAKKSKKIAFF